MERLLHEPKPGVAQLGFGHAEGEQQVVLPLVLQMECTATADETERNMTATIARGYTPLMEHFERYSGTLSLCGSGPSLAAKLHELTGDVLACNGAIGFLLDRGIVPRHAMLWDAAPIVAEFAVPHPDITYFVASRCHPSVFERLAGCKVVVWHAGGDHNVDDFLSDRKIHEPMLQGGTTAVTRGMYLAFALGYKDLHLFGADSCYTDGATHVEGASKVPEGLVNVMVGGRWFKSTCQWAAQIEEIKIIYPMMMQPEVGARITAHDEGMMAWVISIMDRDMRKALLEAKATCELQTQKNGQAVPGAPGVATQPLEETQ